MATAKSDWKSREGSGMESAEHAASGAAQKASDFGHGVADKAKDMGSQVADKAREVGSQVADKARELGSNVADKAREMGSAATEKASQAASFVGKKAGDAATAMGGGMENLAGSIREHGPSEGMFGSATSSVAKSLEETGHYFKEHGFNNLGEDLTHFIRRNPVPVLLAGVAAGYLIARATRR